MRRGAVVAGAAAVGAAAGLALALASGSSHRAVTRLSVANASSLLPAETVAAFAGSSVVADNVAQSLRVPAAEVHDRLHAHVVRRTALVELAYTEDSDEAAARGVQQAASVLAALAPARFPGVRVAVVDPAHAGSVGPPVVRDAGLGALIGLLVGALGALAAARRRRPTPEREPEPVSDTVSVPDAAQPPPPPPPPEPPPPPAEPGWVREARVALAAHGQEFGADRVAEWQAYLDAFAAQAVDGELPPHLRGVFADVFAPLLERARA